MYGGFLIKERCSSAARRDREPEKGVGVEFLRKNRQGAIGLVQHRDRAPRARNVRKVKRLRRVKSACTPMSRHMPACATQRMGDH